QAYKHTNGNGQVNFPVFIQFFLKEKEQSKKSQAQNASRGKGGNQGHSQNGRSGALFPGLVPNYLIFIEKQAQNQKILVDARFPEDAEVPVFYKTLCHAGKAKVIEAIARG